MSIEDKNSQVERLLNELYDLKVTLADISRNVSRMENAVKRSFPGAVSPREATIKRDKLTDSDPPTINRDEALSFFDQLREVVSGANTEAGLRKLDELSIANLSFLARELGASVGKKKPSRRVLSNEILGKVRQSILLRQHTPVGRVD